MDGLNNYINLDLLVNLLTLPKNKFNERADIDNVIVFESDKPNLNVKRFSFLKTKITDPRIIKINSLILKYILINKDNISLKEFKKYAKIKTKCSFLDIFVTQDRFLEVAKNNGLQIKFRKRKIGPNQHGINCKKKKCNCENFKLANLIERHYNCRKVKINAENIDFLVNKYLDLYIQDTSSRHKNIHDLLDLEIEI